MCDGVPRFEFEFEFEFELGLEFFWSFPPEDTASNWGAHFNDVSSLRDK
jgi:hypothetical protein